MKRAASALLMALFLTAIGLAIFLHKLLVLNIPILPAYDYNSWSVEARITLNEGASILTEEDTDSAAPQPVQLSLYLPQGSERYQIIEESFEGDRTLVPENVESQITRSEDDANRVVKLNTTGALDSNTVFYRTTLRSDRTQETVATRRVQQPSTLGQQIVDKQVSQAQRTADEVKEALIEDASTESINSLIEEARGSTSSDFAFARQLYRLAIRTRDNRVRTLQNLLALDGSSIELTSFLLNEADIPARVGNGILLNPDESAATQFSQWLEVNRGQQWFAYDPVTEQFGAQTRYLLWWYGNEPVLAAEGIDDVSIEITSRPDSGDGLGRSVWHEKEKSFFLRHSFVGLPLSTQRVIQVLVLIPVGALIVAALHQMVGISTFGTFTPVLIALSFRETGLLTGVVLFSIIVLIGAVVRSLLNRAQLLVIPRLSAVLTVTVLVIGLLALMLDNFGLRYGLSISLFPIVILAMTIERAALMWEEEGAKETLIAAVGSLFVAVIGYLCINSAIVQHLTFVFPELLLVVLAITVLLGRYNGYKLTEYFRFLALQKQIQQADS